MTKKILSFDCANVHLGCVYFKIDGYTRALCALDASNASIQLHERLDEVSRNLNKLYTFYIIETISLCGSKKMKDTPINERMLALKSFISRIEEHGAPDIVIIESQPPRNSESFAIMCILNYIYPHAINVSPYEKNKINLGAGTLKDFTPHGVKPKSIHRKKHTQANFMHIINNYYPEIDLKKCGRVADVADAFCQAIALIKLI